MLISHLVNMQKKYFHLKFILDCLDDLKFNYKKQLEEKEIDSKVHLQVKFETTTGSVETVEINHVYDEESNGMHT